MGNSKRAICSVCGNAMYSSRTAKCLPTCHECRKKKHGTEYMYRKKKCRCADCRSWYQEYRQSNPPCSEQGCERPVLGRGLCPTHYNKWHRQQRKYEIVCQSCGNTAFMGRAGRKYCTYECAMNAVNAQKSGMSVSDWLNRPGYKRGRTSRTRRARALRKLDKASLGTRGRIIWSVRTCKMCPNIFTVKSSSTDRCCSELCTLRNKKEVLHRKLARRRAKKADAFVENVDRLEVFKRDKYICYLCNRKTYLHAKKTWHPRKATIDHVIPIAAGRENGGVHSYANCRTACQECNSAKSDRGGGEQLALSV